MQLYKGNLDSFKYEIIRKNLLELFITIIKTVTETVVELINFTFFDDKNSSPFLYTTLTEKNFKVAKLSHW